MTAPALAARQQQPRRSASLCCATSAHVGTAPAQQQRERRQQKCGAASQLPAGDSTDQGVSCTQSFSSEFRSGCSSLVGAAAVRTLSSDAYHTHFLKGSRHSLCAWSTESHQQQVFSRCLWSGSVALETRMQATEVRWGRAETVQVSNNVTKPQARRITLADTSYLGIHLTDACCCPPGRPVRTAHLTGGQPP